MDLDFQPEVPPGPREQVRALVADKILVQGLGLVQAQLGKSRKEKVEGYHFQRKVALRPRANGSHKKTTGEQGMN